MTARRHLDELIAGEGVSAEVLEAFKRIPRARFVPPEDAPDAYQDRPIAIPERQTTSQPSLIARMIDAAEVGPSHKVLEVGTGYGFQTALLATLAREVVSVERFETLAAAARANLAAAGIVNARVMVGDGWEGVPDEAPFDAVIVSASAEKVPHALTEQMSTGARLIVPLQDRGGDDVYVFVREETGLGPGRLLVPARFVPLVRGLPG